MKNTFIIAVLISISLMGVFSCTFYNEQEYFGVRCDTLLIDRDTISVYYEDLTPIFTGICASCHNEQFTYRQDIRMDNYENVKASMETGLPWPAINHTGDYEMPYNLPKLSDCDIQRIGVWISTGMPLESKE